MQLRECCFRCAQAVAPSVVFGCHAHIAKTRGKQLNPSTGVFLAGAEGANLQRDKKMAVGTQR